jgi:hypothetical protein
VQEHFAELRKFITFSLNQLETRVRADLLQIERGLGGIDLLQDGMDLRFDGMDAQFAATQTALREISSRLP